MSRLARASRVLCEVPFSDVAGLAPSTTVGHAGSLKLVHWAGQHALIFAGRVHYYEGFTWNQVIRPVQLAYELGARILVLTNAAGGIHPLLEPGSLLAVRNHIEWTAPDCWHTAALGVITPPPPYAPELIGKMQAAAKDLGVKLHEGIYAAVLGPCYETPAEIRALEHLGADAVGMSTAREIRAGHALGMSCAAISCITNRAAGLSDGPIQHEEVLAVAGAQSEILGGILENFLWI